MAIYAISDIHVKPDGTNSEILKKFISLPFKEEDKIFFLGDIFDMLVGPHEQFVDLYDYFFKFLKMSQKQGLEIFYFEGNHDFHLEKLFKDYGIKLQKKPLVFDWNDQKILFCHGDEIELDNMSYKIYRSFIKSSILNLIANKVMPYSVLEKIGHSASSNSRKRNKSRYGDSQNNSKIKDRFRTTAETAQKEFDVSLVICGHSHFCDDYQWGHFRYMNCGYLPNTKNYIKIETSPKFEKL